MPQTIDVVAVAVGAPASRPLAAGGLVIRTALLITVVERKTRYTLCVAEAKRVPHVVLCLLGVCGEGHDRALCVLQECEKRRREEVVVNPEEPLLKYSGPRLYEIDLWRCSKPSYLQLNNIASKWVPSRFIASCVPCV